MNVINFKEMLTQAETKLIELEQIDYEELRLQLVNLKSKVDDFKKGGQSLLEKNDTLQIGVVGHMNVGKSSFLNGLFFDGEPILPKAATTMTAGLSFLEYDEKNSFEVEYYTKEEWNQFVEYYRQYNEILDEYKKKNPKAPDKVAIRDIEANMSKIIISAHEMVTGCSATAMSKVKAGRNEIKEFNDKSELKDILNSYVGIKGEFTHVVKCITIRINDERLKGIRIVDTPGTSDPVLSREMRTQLALNTCHGVFLLSYAGSFFSSEDQAFVRKTLRNKGIARIVILASKYDAALEQVGYGNEKFDLEDKSDEIMKDFQERVNETLSGDTIDLDNLKLNYTSNIKHLIGFMFDMSEYEREKLLRTPDDELDRENKEKKSILNTIHNLRDIYPGRFDTDEDIQETCDGISNFDVIHDSYLEDVFRSHKDEIIGEKIQKYIAEQQLGIIKDLDGIYDYFNRYSSDLKGTDLAKLNATKATGELLFATLDLKFKSIIHDYQNALQRYIKKMLASVHLQGVRQIPTTYTSGPVRCKGWLWGHNRPSITYKQVDTYNLKEKCKYSFEQYSKTITQKWEDFFNSQHEHLKKELVQCVFDYMGKIQDSSFDSNTFTNVITETLSNLLPIGILNLNEIVSKYVSITDEISYRRFTLYDSETEDYKESQLPNRIADLFSIYEKNLLSSVSTTNNAFESDIQDEIESKMDSVNEQIEKMRGNFCDELKKALNKYVKKLEADIEQKETTLSQLDDILKKLKELKKLFSK